MARGGITEVQVEKARDALIARGRRPSIDAIRIELGNTGSKSTIQRHLRALEEREGRRLDDEALLSEGLQATVASAARQLREEAQALIEAAEERHRKEAASLQETLRGVENALAQSTAENADLGTSLAEERDAHAQVCEALHREQMRSGELVAENGALVQRLEDTARHIASLEEKHRQARDSLEHYRTLSKEQRDQDQRNHEAQVQHLHAEIREYQRTLTAKQDELTRVTGDNAALATKLPEAGLRERDARAAHEKTQEAHEEARQRIAELLAERARLDADHRALERTLEVSEAERARLANEIDALAARLTERTARVNRLEGRLEALTETPAEESGQADTKVAGAPGRKDSAA